MGRSLIVMVIVVIIYYHHYYLRLAAIIILIMIIIIGYFTVVERVRFLFANCVKRAQRVSCFTQRVNKNRTNELTVK